uniref:Integrase, catalytic region, zinc finger, CCHC-type, peptidase aspartic, catalytic n=1 Tax=Tanacetum cinerariifolium TaxID=118510 RepID=A0A699H9W5_TANCI|nr:hypothetical protein [Tanacetum cinerariifolium]
MFPQLDLGLVIPKFLPTDDLIKSLNKAITFLSTAITLRYPSTNNQLRTSSNPRNQTTIQDGWEQCKMCKDTKLRVMRVMLQGVMLLELRGKVDLGTNACALTTTAIFQIDDLDIFDSDYDEAPAAHIIVAGAENRPPMLEKSMYNLWASRIRLFIKRKKHGRMMLDSIDNGPLVYPTVKENRYPDPLALVANSPTLYNPSQSPQHSEWSKFVTDVKLAKSLYTTNYDQLYAYLNQHERHANEVCITHKRYPDPLALVANSPTLYNPSQSPQHSGSLMYPSP